MKLLVTGNIGYITTEFIEEAFPECQILLLGETEQKSNRNKSLSVFYDYYRNISLGCLWND